MLTTNNCNYSIGGKTNDMNGKFLITTDNWFYAPNGRKYKAVWGEVKVLDDSFLGIKTNRNSSNWFAYVGNEEKGMLVAGCQIHYAVRCNECPSDLPVEETLYDISGPTSFMRPSEIYVAE